MAFLPSATDFIFAVISESTALSGRPSLVPYLVLLLAGMDAATNARTVSAYSWPGIVP
jgi:cell division protein FtsW (lipid II flippase)